MELNDLSFSDVLNKKRLCHIKWKELINELIRERDASKLSLEEANLKIVELETTLATYKAKELMVENERLISSQVINTLRQELRKEDPISKKINDVEQSVSGLNKAIEKLTSELEKTANSSKDVNNSTSKAKTKCFEEIHIDNNDQDAFVKSKKNEQIVCVDDIEWHIVDVMLSDDELPSGHYDDVASEPSLLEPTLKQKTGSLRNTSSTVNKGDKCDEVPLTDVTATSSQLLANRSGKINKSYSFINEEIPSSTTAKSSGITDVVESNEGLAVRNTYNTEHSYNSYREEKTAKNKTYFRDVENDVSNSIHSCSASGRSSSKSSLKPQNSTRVKTTRKVGSVPYDRYKCILPKPDPIRYLSPYGDGNCGSYFRPTDYLHSHVKLSHQKEKQQLYPCNYCGEGFEVFFELKNHTEQKHRREKNIEKSPSSKLQHT